MYHFCNVNIRRLRWTNSKTMSKKRSISSSKYHVLDPQELKEVLFHDYQLIKQMKCPLQNKAKLLSTLFSINQNSWRVVGITPAALAVFKTYGYKKQSGMGINRSHITQRATFYLELLQTKFNTAEAFWKAYFDNDMTILATSTENMSKSTEIFKNYYPIPADERKLFQTAGYAWKHKDEEIEFLKDLAKHSKNK